MKGKGKGKREREEEEREEGKVGEKRRGNSFCKNKTKQKNLQPAFAYN